MYGRGESRNTFWHLTSLFQSIIESIKAGCYIHIQRKKEPILVHINKVLTVFKELSNIIKILNKNSHHQCVTQTCHLESGARSWTVEVRQEISGAGRREEAGPGATSDVCHLEQTGSRRSTTPSILSPACPPPPPRTKQRISERPDQLRETNLRIVTDCSPPPSFCWSSYQSLDMMTDWNNNNNEALEEVASGDVENVSTGPSDKADRWSQDSPLSPLSSKTRHYNGMGLAGWEDN